MNYKSELMPGHCRFLVPKDQNMRGGVPVRHGSWIPVFWRRQGGSPVAVAHSGFLVLPCPVLSVRREQQFLTGKVLHCLRMKVWVILLGKDQDLLRRQMRAK